jgi:hypothetical protein
LGESGGVDGCLVVGCGGGGEREVVAVDDDLYFCLCVLLFENPYSTKVPVTVPGRYDSAKLAGRLWLR